MSFASYTYIYDEFLAERRFERPLAEIEARLAHMGISGRVGRLAMLRSARELIDQMAKEGQSTIVIVGNDATLLKLMPFLPEVQAMFGYIPIGTGQWIAETLGIPSGAEACDVLAARRIETLDVGRFGDRFFLTDVTIADTTAIVQVGQAYRISPVAGGSITIRNLGGKASGAGNARDGQLELIVRTQGKGKRRWPFAKPRAETRLFLSEGEISASAPMQILVDGQAIPGTRFAFSVVPQRLSCVVGKRPLAAS